MRKVVLVASLAAFTVSSQVQTHPTEQRRVENSCTNDGLIHAEVSPAISKKVGDSITLLQPGARVRETSKLTLPCGFHIDARYGANLVLTNGTEIRRYLENNVFGFAPAFGFSDAPTKSYTLNYHLAANGELHVQSCTDKLKHIKDAPQLCSGFGSATAFFGTKTQKRSTLLAHFIVPAPKGTRVTHFVFEPPIMEDFPVAIIDARVESIFFLPPPDAPGGTITLILSDKQGTFRTYLDTPRG